ncbi:unnamed protein product [Rhizophagus irregularis]|nr:unnamed protein product [Rhizophagus irregularis]
MANGIKLPPVIIFKLINVSREEFPDEVIIQANKEGWMNESEMIWWIENVWTQHARRGANPRSLLILDSFTAHKTSAVRHLYNNWMNDAIKDYTHPAKSKGLPIHYVSNSLDGSEDSLIFDFNKVQEINNRGKGIEENEISSESESESGSESESKSDDESGLEDEGNESESENDYYKENEDRNIVQNWN